MSTLIPRPSSDVPSESGDAFALDALTRIVSTAPELLAVADVFRATLASRVGIALDPVSADGATDSAIVLELVAADPELDALPVTNGVRADGGEAAVERHGFEISASGIRIWATGPEGVHRALTSIAQLASCAQQDAQSRILLAPRRTVDAPRFAWRGLSLDVARTFYGVDAVKRVIDMLDVYKLNVLHLHLTDDQGWRIDIEGWPELAAVGSLGATGDRPGGCYTHAQFRDIVAYAAARFITVVPELDMPGHGGALFRAYPELADGTVPPLEIETAGAQATLNFSTLSPAEPGTWEFVRDAIGEVAGLIPGDFLHLGGDEAFGMADDAHAAFVTEAARIIRDSGKRMIGWQEAARGQVGEGDVLQYWIDLAEFDAAAQSDSLSDLLPPEFLPVLLETMEKSRTDVADAVEKGAKVLISSSSHLYLDRPYGEPATADDQEELRVRVGMPFYSPKSLEEMHAWDPAAMHPSLDEATTIAGVEAAIWCETIANEADLQFMLLPRLASVAEKAWSQHGGSDWAGFEGRLAEHPRIWSRSGWNWFRAASVSWAGAGELSAAGAS